MKKLILVSALASFLMIFTACSDMDKPSPLDTQSASAMGMNGADIPGDSFGDSDPGLAPRSVDGLPFDPENIPPEMIMCTVYFGFDQYAIPPAERAKVKPVADALMADPSLKIVLVGHTDWYGTEEYNLLLSGKRGDAVASYITSLGANPAGAETVARGEAGATPDVAKNSPEAAHDRRVDVVKLK